VTRQQRDALADLSAHIDRAILAWVLKQNDGEVPDIDRLIVAVCHWLPDLPLTLEREIGERLPRLGKMLTQKEIARRHRSRRRKPQGGPACDAAAE
jgi:hypothetical protein